MNAWGPALLAVIVQLIIAVYIYGGIGRAVRDHDAKFEAVDVDQRAQWTQINDSREDVARIKGELKMNGGYYRP